MFLSHIHNEHVEMIKEWSNEWNEGLWEITSREDVGNNCSNLIFNK